MTFFKCWEEIFHLFILEQMRFDPAHDIEHIKRVVKLAKMLSNQENANMHVVIPSAWLHDCVNVPKDSEDRSKGSLMAADKAVAFLKTVSYPEEYLDDIHHAIHAHSFSANIEAKTIEAKVVQDADRMDALGAIGLARCIAYSTIKERPLYDPADPFAENRELDEAKFAIDHFYTKLLKLPNLMKTEAGKLIAKQRADFLQSFLDNLKHELP